MHLTKIRQILKYGISQWEKGEGKTSNFLCVLIRSQACFLFKKYHSLTDVFVTYLGAFTSPQGFFLIGCLSIVSLVVYIPTQKT